jgi:amino acid transporter
MSNGNTQVSADSAPSAPSGGFKRVLSLWDLVLFGLAFVGPTAPYSMFGLATVKSQGHLPLVYLLLSSKPFYSPEHFEWKPILGATSLAALSYLGFDGISTLSEDAKDPGKDIWRATLLVCFLAGGLFVLQSYLGQMVWPDYTTFHPVETAFMDIGKRIGGSALYLCISLVLLVGGLASAIAGQASASRLLVGMGRDALLPRRLFAYVHPRLGTPVYSVMLMGAIHLAGALIFRYAEAAELVNFGALLGFMLVNLAVVRHFFFRLQQRTIELTSRGCSARAARPDSSHTINVTRYRIRNWTLRLGRPVVEFEGRRNSTGRLIRMLACLWPAD